MFRKLRRSLRKIVRSAFSGKNRGNLRRDCPAQLHDLFLRASIYTENLDAALSGIREVEEIEDRRKQPGPLFPNFYDSGPRYLEFLRRIIEEFEFGIIVETGVAHGHSTRKIIGALEAVHKQRPELEIQLHSVDIDQRTHWEDIASDSRWTFHLSTDTYGIENILMDIGEIDMFIHDSDHGYRHQMREYRAAWRHLRTGGVLVSDDVSWSNAFLDFCNENRVTPVILSEAPKVAGAVRKPL